MLEKIDVKMVMVVALMLGGVSFVAAQGNDAEGSRDHPLISRFPGSTIREYVQKDFDAYDLPLSKVASWHGKYFKTLHLEGKVTAFYYVSPEGGSAPEVFHSYESGLKNRGFQELFTCAYNCGDAPPDGTSPIRESFGNYPDDTRYLAAKLARAEGDVYVALWVYDSKFDIKTFLTVVEAKPGETGVVTVNAVELPKDKNYDAILGWGGTTLDKLAPFLPDPKPWGFTPELPKPEPDFKAFANQNSLKYLALLVHKNWFFGDPELYSQLEEVEKEKAAQKKQSEEAIEEFNRVHGAEMQALEKSHNAELDAATKRAQELFRQGKYEEGKAVIDQVKPFHYAPLDALSASLDKKAKDLDERERNLLGRRRSVSFRIYTNRTPSTTAFGIPAKPMGMLAGRTFYRQDRGSTNMGGGRSEALVDLAVYLGPENFQDPVVKQGESEPKVKCIVVWAWIESRPDTLQADEAAVKKVLATIDYNGLAKLIEP